MRALLREHWPEYLGEAAGLGLFMMAACALGTALGHPDSPLVRAVPDPLARRALMGIAMGLTAIALITSPWGQRSGAHLNPATTLAFWRLGKVARGDAIWYALAQGAGGLAGVMAAALALGALVAHPSVRYVATEPGPAGALAAAAAEAAIAFLLITAVLHVSNTASVARLTPVVAGALVAVFITVEAPISGMSMNPARSLASAAAAGAWASLWIYFVAPPAGMLLAAELYARRYGRRAVYCAKLDHDNGRRCIFRCRHAELGAAAPAPSRPAAAVAPRS